MMSIFDKLSGKSDRDILKDQIRRDTDKRAKKTMTIADYASTLGSCKRTFGDTIAIERLNALERRDKRIGDAAQKRRIHDAAVGLLAIEELEIDLQSAVRAQDMAAAQKKLARIVHQVGRLDPDAEITKKDIKAQMGQTFDDTNDTEPFTERADLVDEQFVEYLIQGLSMEECLSKKISGGAVPTETYDNLSSSDPEADKELVDEILRKNSDLR